MIMTNFDPSDKGKLSHVECVAVAARALYQAMGESPSWAEVTNAADGRDDRMLAKQAEFMRTVRPVIDKFERHCGGVRHRHSLSVREREQVVSIWRSEIPEDTEKKGLELAAKKFDLPHPGHDTLALVEVIVEAFRGAVEQAAEALANDEHGDIIGLLVASKAKNVLAG